MREKNNTGECRRNKEKRERGEHREKGGGKGAKECIDAEAVPGSPFHLACSRSGRKCLSRWDVKAIGSILSCPSQYLCAHKEEGGIK